MSRPTAPSRSRTRSRSQASPVRFVFLTGFMGAGKTTVGEALARRLRWPFIDLDQRIEERERRSIPEIFHASGEAHFRRLERSLLDELLATKGGRRQVVALGGGTFVLPGVRARLRRAGGLTVFLDAPVDKLRARVQRLETRPLARDPNLFRQLHRARRGRYMKADVRISTATAPLGAVVAQIIAALRKTSGRTQESDR